MTLDEIILEFESNLDSIDFINPKKSKGSIGWHIQHCITIINAVCKKLIESNPEKYQWKFNFIRTFFLSLGYFPKAKVKAPKFTNPEKVDIEALQKDIKTAKNLIHKIQNLDKKSSFKHPIFGYLNLKQGKRFLYTHSFHHLKIIRDIKR